MVLFAPCKSPQYKEITSPGKKIIVDCRAKFVNEEAEWQMATQYFTNVIKKYWL
jgi:hypothetical protein